MVPNGWKKGVIEDIAKVSSGGTPSRQNDLYWLGGQIPWVTTAEVKFGVINDTEQKITEAGLKNSSAKLFPKDTILMAMYGQGKTRGQVAKLGIEASTNQACAALLLNDDFEVDYYYQYLVSQYENIRELANSGGQQNLSAGIIKSIHVPIPPQLEQRKIATILGTWDSAISATERLIDNSKQQKKALMQQLLTGKKRLLDDSGKPFEGEWGVNRLDELATKISDGIHSTPKYAESSNIRFVNGNNLKNGKIAFQESTRYVDEKDAVNHYRNLTNRTILLSINGTIGNLATYNDENIVLGKSACYINVKPNVDLNFVFYTLASDKIQSFFVTELTGSTIKNLSLKTVKSTPFQLPSYKEQKKIASVLTNAEKEIELLEQQLADLKQEKKALMQQLLTGKRRVKVDDKEVA